MKFIKGKIAGSFIVELEKREDERGFFARMFCIEEFKKQGVDFKPVQINNSFNYKKGSIRGLHYQEGEYAEAKLFRCVNGSMYDLTVDLRKDSPTYKQWMGVILTPENRIMTYVPKGCAHGYQALEDKTETIYLVTTPFAPNQQKGIRWNDPLFKIEWPIQEVILSEKDRNQKDYDNY